MLPPEDASESPPSWSRRRVLKELCKAPGVLGALALPPTWIAPALEMVSLHTVPTTCSIQNCPPPVCNVNWPLILHIPSGPTATVSFGLTYQGATNTGNDITVTYTASSGTLTYASTVFTIGACYSTAAGSSASNCITNSQATTVSFITSNLNNVYALHETETISAVFSLVSDTTSPSGLSLKIDDVHSLECAQSGPVP